MPYDPNLLISKRRLLACEGGRPAEIRRLVALWWSPSSSDSAPAPMSQSEIEHKIEELFYFATLVLVGTGKPNRPPRLDFNLMHVLTATLFVPSILEALNLANKRRLLEAMLLEVIMQVVTRGRPRVDPLLVMSSFTASPHPPAISQGRPNHNTGDAIGTEDDCINPWLAIIEESTHAPDAHVVKAIRSLCYAAKLYGETPAGSVPGAFRGGAGDGKEETHVGMGRLDGTLFVRAAGIVMDVLGWVTHGQKAGTWDRSCLGYEEAWAQGNEAK